MQTSTSRWVVTGVLGFAMIGTGCANGTTAGAVSQEAGPAVVLEAGRLTTARPPAATAAKVSAGAGALTSASTPDDAAKKVPAAKPKSASPETPPSADTP